MPTIQERKDNIDQALAEAKASTLTSTLSDPINVLIILADEKALKQCPQDKLLAAIETQIKAGSKYFKIVKPQATQPVEQQFRILLPWERKEEKKSEKTELLEHDWKSMELNKVEILFDASIIPRLETEESVNRFAEETAKRFGRT